MCCTIQLPAGLFRGGRGRKGEMSYNQSHIFLKSLRILSEMICIIRGEKKNTEHSDCLFFFFF